MKKINNCIDFMDFTRCWSDWKDQLKRSIEDSRVYYQDETVQIMLIKLDNFLRAKVCSTSLDEMVIEAMWEVATDEERRIVATLFLKIAERL